MIMSERIKQEDDFPITAEALRITGIVLLVIFTLGLMCKCNEAWRCGQYYV